MFYIHFLFLALPGEKEPGWGWRRFKEIEITQIERHLISYLCRSIAGCKTTRVLKGNSLVSPPWCGYLVHIFGIFYCSYSFGMWSLVCIWHRRGQWGAATDHLLKTEHLRAIPSMYTLFLHWSSAVTNSIAEAKRRNLKFWNIHNIPFTCI